MWCVCASFVFQFFFFKQKTAYEMRISDWSSDVCSSDLRVPNIDKAVTEIDALLQERPDDPYFHELKGQMLLEPGRVAESVPEYEAAVRVMPQSAQLRPALATAQVALPPPAMDPAAPETLTVTLAEDPHHDAPTRICPPAPCPPA